MIEAGTAWSGAPVRPCATTSDAFVGAETATRSAAFKARSVFVRRALRRVVNLSNPGERASILVLGGDGRDAFELVDRFGEFVDIDVDVVSSRCDEAVIAAAESRPLDAPGRLRVLRRPPLTELFDPRNTVASGRDLVVLDSLLDDLDEAGARRALEASFERLRPRGVAWGAHFDERLGSSPMASRDGFATWAWSVVNRGGTVRRLDRGPNVWIGVSRSGSLPSIEE